MKRFHIALSVGNITQSIVDYTKRLGSEPTVVIDNEYALWRTATLNFSIRKTENAHGQLRHVGWEDDQAEGFTSDEDVNGIIWENFSAQDQQEEIVQTWPKAL